MHPSGGLTYHLKALRYRHSLWRPFRETVGLWLSTWTPPQTKLLLFGSSGGYCVPPAFLRKFSEVTCIEPDVFARMILRRRLPRVRFATLYHLLNQVSFLEWQKFLHEHRDHAVLFSNVLGQLAFLQTSNIEKALEQLFSALETSSWASFHDLFSTTEPILQDQSILISENFQILPYFSSVLPIAATVINHETFNVTQKFAKGAVPASWWRISPRANHLIGFMAQVNDGANLQRDKESRSPAPDLLA